MKKIIHETDIDLHVYPDMSQMEDSFFAQLVEKEAEWWGYKPYGEYLICKDVPCRSVQSIEEVYGTDAEDRYVPLRELEKDGPKTPPCPECGSPSERIYDPKDYAQNLRQYLSPKVYGILLAREGELLGATHAVKDTRKAIMDNIINYRQGYEVPRVLEKISEILGETTSQASEDRMAVCFNKIAVSARLRGLKLYPKLVNILINMYPENDDLPLMIDTRFDTQAYPLLVGAGFEAVDSDQYGGVMIMNKRYGDYRETMSLSQQEFAKRFQERVGQARESQRILLANNPTLFGSRKKYAGLKSLKNFN